MDVLRRETVAKLDTLKTERDAAVAERDAARALTQRADDRHSVLESEGTKMRNLLREAQERAVEVTKTTLQELSRRDVEARAHADVQRREYAEVYSRAEVASQESRGLKRRVDELLEHAEEVKRLRTATQRQETQRARDEAEREALRAQLDAARTDKETLRATNLELENRIAVLDASVTLDACRRALGGDEEAGPSM